MSSLDKDLLVLVINLDRSPERLIHMTERLNRLPFEWKRLPAIDGGVLSELRHEEVDENLYECQHGKPLARAEVGCYLSHVKAMRQFLSSGKQYLLLFEDDAYPEEAFVDVLVKLLNQPDTWDIVKLSGFHAPHIIKRRKLTHKYCVGVPMTRHLNVAAVLYNRQAAQQFVDSMLPMSLPFDHALEQPWLYGARLRVVCPNPVRAGDGTESTIVGTKTRKFKWYRRFSTYGFRIKNEVARVQWAISSKS